MLRGLQIFLASIGIIHLAEWQFFIAIKWIYLKFRCFGSSTNAKHGLSAPGF